MGVGGISIWQLLIVLVIILLLFGTKKLRSIGADLGSAVKGFRNSLRDEERRDTEEAATIEHKQAHKTENPSQRQQDDADFKIKSGNDENK